MTDIEREDRELIQSVIEKHGIETVRFLCSLNDAEIAAWLAFQFARKARHDYDSAAQIATAAYNKHKARKAQAVHR